MQSVMDEPQIVETQFDAQFDESTDFVVVGTGGGAMCAGLVARSKGKQVVLLEKASVVGGTTARSGGVMWVPNNRFLKRDGIIDSFENALTYLEALSSQDQSIQDQSSQDQSDQGDSEQSAPAATPERRHTYLHKAPEMIEFLLSQNIPVDRYRYWPDYYDELPGGLEVGRSVGAGLFDLKQLGDWQQKLMPGFLDLPVHLEEALILPNMKRSWRSFKALLRVVGRIVKSKFTGSQFASAGQALQGWQLLRLLQAGAYVRTQSPVHELIMDEGKVIGVRTEKNGQPWMIKARLGVLVGAGGFAHNQAMRDQYIPNTQSFWSSASPADTGEMIQEMARCGAQLAQMEERVGNQCTIPPDSKAGEIRFSAQGIAAKPHAMLVDQTGVRYMNEGGSYMAFCKAMLQHNQTTPAVPSYAILDSQYIKKYMLCNTMPGSKKPQSWYDSGYLKKAGSIEGLAEQLNIKPDVLSNSVKRFNGFVDNNKDEDFNRGERAYDRWLGDFLQQPNETLGRIEKPPFYAIPILPGDVGTYGGVMTDECARVLRENGSVIEGLYACGVSTASVMGRSYPGAGSSVGPSMTWGYVAAQHACQ